MGREAPGDQVPINWEVYTQALDQAFDGAENAIAVSWCRFADQNPAANIYAPMLVVIGTAGVFASAGKKAMLGLGGPKFHTVEWAQVKTYGDDDYLSDDESTVKYLIGFNGPGQNTLGILSWDVYGKTFQAKKNQQKAIAAATERDRIYDIIQGLMS